ncbi:HNH endonuclease signature motif containing protein, partial [Glaciibacter superstes]|uniref:HNH endonuclease signature motif containing protein n=1 Tax=Glaciibacter superstes TaxID=501023 RepID=UPI0003B5B224
DQDIENREGIEAGEIIPGAELDTEYAGTARPIGEKRADILRAALERITRDADTPTLGGAAPTVMVHVNAQDLASNTGVGWIDGVEDPINLKTVRQMMCAGGYQTIIYGDDGDILHLGGKQRCFTTNQRKAIIARDGGCIIPGCNAPVSWVELHHVTEWAKGGPTEISNGVALCWYHHHSIETSGWKIRMVGGVPQIKAPYWMDPTQIWRHTNGHRANHTTDPSNSRPGTLGNLTAYRNNLATYRDNLAQGDPDRTGQGTTAPTDGPPRRE